MEVASQEKTHKLWECPPDTVERQPGYKSSKEEVLEAEKAILFIKETWN